MTAPEWDSVHDLLDDVATIVGAPALVEDPRHVVLAYSRHEDPGDPVRQRTILGRRATPEVVEWLVELGISRATGVVHVPANPQLGMRPRVCLPLRRRGQLVGYLWFIDHDDDITDFDLDRAWQCAEAIVDLLAQAGELPVLARAGTVRAALRGELGDDPAVERLLDARIEHGGAFQVSVVQAAAARRSAADVRQVLSVLATSLAPQAAMAALVEDVGAVVHVTWAGTGDTGTHVRRALQDVDTDVVVGIGDPVRQFSDLPRSLETAHQAATCAALWPDHGPVLDWTSAGLYRFVPALAAARGPTSTLVQRLRQVVEDPDLEHLARTTEVYLDQAGNAQDAARRLVLHRTTLYQRLQRFSEVTGIDLRTGEGRTVAHLAIKAARFASNVPLHLAATD